MAGSGRRKARPGRAEPAGPCPECGTRMVRTFSGIRCPRFSACGRGGLEETAARLKNRHRLRPPVHTETRDPGSVGSF
ncbi:MAG TPA: hypothetical protein VI997_03925 [Candidatus Thermoplasmatota archaeon]|nr:hypothetical protein [Candidatus Thermoplasmatota archaeon]